MSRESSVTRHAVDGADTRPVGPISAAIEKALPPSYVVPASELEADLPKGPYGLEPHRPMECHARGIWQGNAGNGRVKARIGERRQQSAIKRAAYAAAARRFRDVHGH